jgi:CMP-N,N'-diacetyllegionaminic acid synthase
MDRKVLVIGYGSIGQRHVNILNKINSIGPISVLTAQTGLSHDTIKSLEDIPALNPDYVVVASPTAKHYAQLKFLDDKLMSSKILVEKPLFDSGFDLEIKNNEVYVGYNLRFHPILAKIKEAVSNRKIWSIQVFCGSYLPDWRPGRDYRETSSASSTSGGVLLDLSHELDYIQWLAGHLDVNYVVNEKVSVLDIDSDDLALISARTESGAHVHISLNYFTRNPLRQILLDGDGVSIRADLVSNRLDVVADGEASNFSWPELDRDDTYLAQHRAILTDDFSKVCTFSESQNTMKLIDSIRSFRRT